MLERSFVIGIDHHATPIGVREALSKITEAEAIEGLKDHAIHSPVVVSTCNRYEVYGISDSPVVARQAVEQLLRGKDMELDSFGGRLYHKTGVDMVRHGFAVASSLESMVVGEPQILGQFKKAYGISAEACGKDPFMERFFSSAFRVGKRVRSETAIARQSVSIASAAVDLAKDIFGDLGDKTVLVVGAGEMGVHAVEHLKAAGAQDILVTNRSAERAQQLAANLGANILPYSELTHGLAKADVVVTSTAASDYIIDAAMVKTALKERGQQPIFMIDIAVPRDIDPQVDALDNCFLYDVDHLSHVAEKGSRKRRGEMRKALTIVEEEVLDFVKWSESRKNLHMVKYLREFFEKEREEVLVKHKDITAEQATRLLVNKLLHYPIKAINDGTLEAEAKAQMLELLFPSGCTRHKTEDKTKN